MLNEKKAKEAERQLNSFGGSRTGCCLVPIDPDLGDGSRSARPSPSGSEELSFYARRVSYSGRSLHRVLTLCQAVLRRSEASMFARAWANAHHIASSKVSHGPLQIESGLSQCLSPIDGVIWTVQSSLDQSTNSIQYPW